MSRQHVVLTWGTVPIIVANDRCYDFGSWIFTKLGTFSAWYCLTFKEPQWRRVSWITQIHQVFVTWTTFANSSKNFEDKYASGFPLPHHSSLVSAPKNPLLAAPIFDSIDLAPSRRISPCWGAFGQESAEPNLRTSSLLLLWADLPSESCEIKALHSEISLWSFIVHLPPFLFKTPRFNALEALNYRMSIFFNLFLHVICGIIPLSFGCVDVRSKPFFFFSRAEEWPMSTRQPFFCVILVGIRKKKNIL